MPFWIVSLNEFLFLKVWFLRQYLFDETKLNGDGVNFKSVLFKCIQISEKVENELADAVELKHFEWYKKVSYIINIKLCRWNETTQFYNLKSTNDFKYET